MKLRLRFLRISRRRCLLYAYSHQVFTLTLGFYCRCSLQVSCSTQFNLAFFCLPQLKAILFGPPPRNPHWGSSEPILGLHWVSSDRLAAAEARGFAFIEFQDAQTALRAFTLRHRATIQHHGAPKRLLLVCIYSCPFDLFYVISAFTFGQFFSSWWVIQHILDPQPDFSSVMFPKSTTIPSTHPLLPIWHHPISGFWARAENLDPLKP